MRGWPVVASVVVIGVIASVAFLWYASFPACGCSGLAASVLAVERVDVGGADRSSFVVRDASPDLTYGEVLLIRDEEERLVMVVGVEPVVGEWSARWDRTALTPENRVVAGDVIEGRGPGTFWFVDLNANSIMSVVEVRPDDHLA